MKKEVSPALTAVVIAIIVVVLGGIYWKISTSEEKAIVPKGKTITLPPSQVGTKLGNQVLGNEVQAPGIPAK